MVCNETVSKGLLCGVLFDSITDITMSAQPHIGALANLNLGKSRSAHDSVV